MSEFFGKLFGLREVTLSDPGVRLELAREWAPWVWAFLLLAATAFAAWSYWRLIGPVAARASLATLRTLTIAALLVMIAGPQLVKQSERIEKDKGKGATANNGGRAPAKVEDPTVMEIDLHLEKLVENEERLTDGEKLSFQLDYFERMLNTAIRLRKRRLVAIHGVGEGVLREEVRKMLQYYEGCRFDDADPRRYGYGATAIDIVHH